MNQQEYYNRLQEMMRCNQSGYAALSKEQLKEYMQRQYSLMQNSYLPALEREVMR